MYFEIFHMIVIDYLEKVNQTEGDTFSKECISDIKNCLTK